MRHSPLLTVSSMTASTSSKPSSSVSSTTSVLPGSSLVSLSPIMATKARRRVTSVDHPGSRLLLPVTCRRRNTGVARLPSRGWMMMVTTVRRTMTTPRIRSGRMMTSQRRRWRSVTQETHSPLPVEPLLLMMLCWRIIVMSDVSIRSVLMTSVAPAHSFTSFIIIIIIYTFNLFIKLLQNLFTLQ